MKKILSLLLTIIISVQLPVVVYANTNEVLVLPNSTKNVKMISEKV